MKGEIKLSKRYHATSIYPIWIDGAEWSDCVPIDFINTQYIDMRGESYKTGLNMLIKALKNAIERLSSNTLEQENVSKTKLEDQQPNFPSSSQPIDHPPRGRSNHKVIISLAGLALILIIASFIGIGAYNNHNNQVNATATVASQSRLPVIAQNSDPYTLGGNLALSDPLNQPFHWPNFSNKSAGGACQFTNGAYHISYTQSNSLFTCLAQGTTDYANLTFEVEMNIIKGDCGGVVIRDDGTLQNDYIYIICQDGTYSFSLFKSGKNMVLKSSSSPAIHSGLNMTNTIAVVANGNRFDPYVNRQMLASVSDPANTFTHGDVGVIVESLSNPTEVVYRNVRVWT